MMNVGVNLEDTVFARALVRGLAAEGRNLYFALTDDGDIGVDFDLILTDREPENSYHVQLVKDPEESTFYDGPPYRIFRYEDASRIVSSLLFIHYRMTGRNLEFSDDIRCRILSFTSLSGSYSSTAMALLTGELLHKHFGCRCLYLNLCPVDGSKCFLPFGSSKGLLTLLYYLHQDKDFPLTSFIRQNLHVDYIDTNVSNPYFDELDSLQLHRLLKKVDDLGKYTYLILDLGNHLSRCNKSLLAKSEDVVFVIDDAACYPKSFTEEVGRMMEKFCTEGRIRQVSLERRQCNRDESETLLQENGLLDLSAMKEKQWEAGRLVKEMMEHKEYDS